jgi:hypothetical protein
MFTDCFMQVHQLICEYLPTDKDIAAYAQVCSKTNEGVTSSVWRKEFLCAFDPIEHATAEVLHAKYVERRRFAHHYVEFDDTPHPLHHRCLSMLRELIIRKSSPRKHRR